MLIYYDSEYVQELEEKLYAKFMEEIEDRTKVHLSDLCHCQVKAWCRLTGIVESPPDSRGIGIMMIGMVGQTLFQQLYPPEWTEYVPDLNLPEDMQLPAHLDIFVQEPEKTFPVEIKWSRRNVTRGSDVGKSWLMQITGYMARTNSKDGKLVIFNIMAGKIHAFKLIMTDDELEQRREELEADKANILEAVEQNNPNSLIVWENECKYCNYRPSRKRKKSGLGPTCPRYKGVMAPEPDTSLLY